MMTRDMEQRLAKINELPDVLKVQAIQSSALDQPLILIEYLPQTQSNRLHERQLCQNATHILQWTSSVRSHTKGAILLSEAPYSIGIDIEKTDRRVKDLVRKKLWHYFKKEDVKDLSTLQLWCLWESVFKTTQLYEPIDILEFNKKDDLIILKAKQKQLTLQLTLQEVSDYWIATCHL